MPANVIFEEAAPSPEGSHYALSLIRAAKVRSGQDVLVNGATRGIGSAVVQLLNGLGANVTAVCATGAAPLLLPPSQAAVTAAAITKTTRRTARG